MIDRVTGMQVFAKVAELGSLSAAARALGMSQTMATKHIAAIEQRLDVKLLHRTTRRLTLTEAGQRYLETVERILIELEEADAAASAYRLEVRGTLRVNAPVDFGAQEIAPMLAEFARLHPKLTVELGLNDRVIDLVEEGWDLSVRIGLLADSTMIARKLSRCRTAVCAAPAYLAERGMPKTIDDLREHNCLGYTLSRWVGPKRWFFGTDGAVPVPISGNLIANNGKAIVAAAVAGQGLAYQPTFLVGAEIRARRLISVALDHPTIELPVYAFYPSDRRPPAKIRAFLAFLEERIEPSPRWDRSDDDVKVPAISA